MQSICLNVRTKIYDNFITIFSGTNVEQHMKAVRYLMCIVAYRNNGLHDFVDDTLKQLYSNPSKRYKHESSAQHSFNLQ